MEPLCSFLHLFFLCWLRRSCKPGWKSHKSRLPGLWALLVAGICLKQPGESVLSRQKPSLSSCRCPWLCDSSVPSPVPRREPAVLSLWSHSSISPLGVLGQALWPSHALRILCTAAACGTTKSQTGPALVVLPPDCLHPLNICGLMHHAAGEPSYTYLSHLIFPLKSIFPVNLFTL